VDIKGLAVKLTAPVYRRVFNREMSPAEVDFAHSLSWVGAGTFVSTALLSVFSILGGRLLGPAEYGKFTLIQSIAAFLCVPMLMGLDVAMLKYNAEKSDLTRQRIIVSTAYVIISGLMAVSVGVMLLLAQPLASVFGASPELFRFSISLAVLLTIFGLAQTTLRSVNRMRAFALSQPMETGILLVMFGVFVALGRLTYQGMVYSRLTALAVAALIIHFRYTRQYVSFSFDAAWGRALSRFAFAYMPAVISSVVYGQIGKIIVARYMSIADVGIYGAYFVATMNIAYVFWGIFNKVFLPTASRYKDKRPIVRRLNRLAPLIVVVGTPLVMGIGYILLLFYGGGYPFNLWWLALFAAASTCFVVRAFYISLSTSEGAHGAFLSSVSGVTTALVNLGLCLLLVPIIGISGAMVAAIAGYAAGLVVILWKGRWHPRGD